MDGFINLDKDGGPSSQGAVAAVKRLLGEKAGHCGALDPLATGVLPICLGRATRLAEYIMGREKSYLAEVCFGVETDSYDAQGAALAERDASHITARMVEALLPKFTGLIMQRPPALSALKRGGEPLYKKRRRGEDVAVEPRPVWIYGLRLLEFRPGVHPLALLEIRCGQGAYIRSLSHDLGRELASGAHVTMLRRTGVGDFRLEDSYTFAQIAALTERGGKEFIIPIGEALSHLPAFQPPERDWWRVAHGNGIQLPPAAFRPEPALRLTGQAGEVLAIGHMEKQEQVMLKIDKVLVEADRFDEQRPCPVCAIGNFDGLHLGHRALFQMAAEKKRELGGSSAMVTFSPHPLALIKGEAPMLLIGDALKRALLKERFGVDRVVTLNFDRKLMNSSPEAFVDEIIVARLQARQVVVGYNFTFGAHGAGTARLLRQLCEERGVAVAIVDEVRVAYGVVSSTNIRRHLAAGEMEAVNAMLGYWFTLEGPVVRGNQLGRSFGYPTANLTVPERQAMPPRGVYAARVVRQGRSYAAVANFGVKPTIGGEIKPLVEAHLFDVEPDLYGETIRVCFGKYLRPERRFAGTAELIAQINADSAAARDFLQSQPENCHLPNPIL